MATMRDVRRLVTMIFWNNNIREDEEDEYENNGELDLNAPIPCDRLAEYYQLKEKEIEEENARIDRYIKEREARERKAKAERQRRIEKEEEERQRHIEKEEERRLKEIMMKMFASPDPEQATYYQPKEKEREARERKAEAERQRRIEKEEEERRLKEIMMKMFCASPDPEQAKYNPALRSQYYVCTIKPSDIDPPVDDTN